MPHASRGTVPYARRGMCRLLAVLHVAALPQQGESGILLGMLVRLYADDARLLCAGVQYFINVERSREGDDSAQRAMPNSKPGSPRPLRGATASRAAAPGTTPGNSIGVPVDRSPRESAPTAAADQNVGTAGPSAAASAPSSPTAAAGAPMASATAVEGSAQSATSGAATKTNQDMEADYLRVLREAGVHAADEYIARHNVVKDTRATSHAKQRSEQTRPRPRRPAPAPLWDCTNTLSGTHGDAPLSDIRGHGADNSSAPAYGPFHHARTA